MALAGPWLGGLTLVLLVTPRGPLGAGFRELELELEAGGSGSHSGSWSSWVTPSPSESLGSSNCSAYFINSLRMSMGT